VVGKELDESGHLMEVRVSNHDQNAGRLFVVATPIGNLGDMTARAKQVLADVDLIAAEDTRHTRALLNHFGIETPMRPYHDHNEHDVTDALLKVLGRGEDIALVSDAGTPQISDPGFLLVREALHLGVAVIPVAGPSALSAALSVSGIPAGRFVFEGFLPARKGQRKSALQALRRESRTLVFYEAPHRIAATLAEMAAVFGPDRQAMLFRELTKLHEQLTLGTLESVVEAFTAGDVPERGEFVVIVQGEPWRQASDPEAERLLSELLKELPPARAVDVVVRLTGQSRKALYRLAMSFKPDR
jgi:16S rRNA (cytidine1402-2'-O)-methyltransferase